MKYTTLLIKLKNPKGKIVDGLIVVRDGFALAVFNDDNLAKQLYEIDLKEGKDVGFNEKKKAYIQRFKGKKKEKIAEILKAELKQAGGDFIEK